MAVWAAAKNFRRVLLSKMGSFVYATMSHCCVYLAEYKETYCTKAFSRFVSKKTRMVNKN